MEPEVSRSDPQTPAPDAGSAVPSPIAAAIINLRAVVASEAERRHDQSTPRGQLIVALAKHLAHRRSNLDPSHLCMGNAGGQPTLVIAGTIHVELPMQALWELFIPEAEQAVELISMEWKLAQEVLQIRWVQ